MECDIPAHIARAGEWKVAFTKPQSEQRLVDAVRVLGILSFAPREEIKRTYDDPRTGKRCTKFWTRPIFDSYVFFDGDQDAILDSGLAISVLHPSVRDRKKIDHIYLAHLATPLTRAKPSIQVGLKVKIVSGPCMGIEGEVEKFGDTIVYLRTKMFGDAAIEVPRENIEPFFGD